MMSDSLLASARVVPASSAASVGRSPTAPVIAVEHDVALTTGGLGRGLLPEPGEGGRELGDLRLEELAVGPARGQADDAEPVGVGADEVERLRADGAGRAEDHDVAGGHRRQCVRSRAGPYARVERPEPHAADLDERGPGRRRRPGGRPTRRRPRARSARRRRGRPSRRRRARRRSPPGSVRPARIATSHGTSSPVRGEARRADLHADPSAPGELSYAATAPTRATASGATTRLSGDSSPTTTRSPSPTPKARSTPAHAATSVSSRAKALLPSIAGARRRRPDPRTTWMSSAS